MAYHRIGTDGELRIYEYTEDAGTFSGYSSELSHTIKPEELIKLYQESGFKVTIEKIECPTT
jgi:hypothetical protein